MLIIGCNDVEFVKEKVSILKAKKGFILREMLEEYMIVAVGKASNDFSGFIRTDEVGAFYWRELEKGCTEEELVAKMLENFENLDEETARRDLHEFLTGISFAIDQDE